MNAKTPVTTVWSPFLTKPVTAFARALSQQGIRIISTGGTARLLSEDGIEVTAVAEVTGAPEMMDGVKTLNPMIHGGILARRDDANHRADMDAHGIAGIDLVVVNLYPFDATLARTDASRDELVENIDIGGPAMIRAAARATISSPSSPMPVIMTACWRNCRWRDNHCDKTAAGGKSLCHTARYDATIASWMTGDNGDDPLTTELSLGGTRTSLLRYGENSHQQAGLYRLGSRQTRPGVLTATQIQGKPLSYNNINDTDAAFELVAEFDVPTIAIIKHANPCGVPRRQAWMQHGMQHWPLIR